MVWCVSCLTSYLANPYISYNKSLLCLLRLLRLCIIISRLIHMSDNVHSFLVRRYNIEDLRVTVEDLVL